MQSMASISEASYDGRSGWSGVAWVLGKGEGGLNTKVETLMFPSSGFL